MKTWERWAFSMLTLAVTVTGVAYLWMKHVLITDDPFAVVNHPWQGFMLGAHVVFSPALILLFGIVLNSHILKKIGAGRASNRTSGLMACAMFFTMIGTGYFLQVASSALLMKILVVAHVVSGSIFSLVYVAHLVISARLSRLQLVQRAVEAA